MEDFTKVKTGDLVEAIQERGFFVTKKPLTVDYRKKIDLKRFRGGTFKFGVVSDTHCGSRYQQLTHLHTFYALLKRRKISTVLHCGDLVEGERLYRGQEYERFLHGADAQIAYAIENYPKFKGICTKIIGGSHDYSFFKLAGVDVLKRVAKVRKDIDYLGMFGGYLEMNGILAYLHHGTGGVSYARSYKLQKLIEQLAPEQKPNMLFEGHFHVSCHIPMYRNVVGWQLPCFQAQTPYLKGKGLYPEIAGLICEVTPDKRRSIAKVKFEVIPFYVPVKDDF